MEKIEYVDHGSPVAGPYTPAVRVGNLIFVSGHVADKDVGGIKEQTLSILNKIKNLLESCGTTVVKILKVGVYLRDVKSYSEMNEAYKKFFVENEVTKKFPARTTIQALPPIEGFDIEIDVIASI